MIRSILILPKYRVAEMDGDPDSVLITITDPHYKARLRDNWGDVLRLSFSDATRPSPSVTLFSEQDAANVRSFCSLWHRSEKPVRLVVNCEYGVSRSAAIALCVSRQFGVPVQTHKGAADLAEERTLPVADLDAWGVVSPNVRVLDLLYPSYLVERSRSDYRLMLLKQNTVAELLPLE